MNRGLPPHSKLIDPYCIEDGDKFRLKNVEPGDTQGLDFTKPELETLHSKAIKEIDGLQQMLYAQAQWAVLLIVQAMDSGGKDSLIRYVMSGVNPQGCKVYSFKEPTAEDLSHDYLWRASKGLPERGHIGIFNRSYYEEVLVARIHPQILDSQRIPPVFTGKKIWKHRFEDMSAYERYLTRNGIVIRKLFLYISKDEQKKRFLSRLDEPEKNWKFAESDVREREHWDDYMHAYEDMIRNTASDYAPWYVIPADHKWFARLVATSILVETLKSLKLEYPKVDAGKEASLKAAREALVNERVLSK